MKKTIYRSLVAIVFTLAATGASAQMKTSYFMEGSLPRYDMNSALIPQNSYFSFAFGNTGFNLNNNFLAVDKLLYPVGNGRYGLFLHPSVDANKYLKRMPSHPSLGIALDYNLLGFGRYSRKHNYFWSFALDVRATADVALPKEMFRILKNLKNGTYDMGDLAAETMAWTEMAFGYAMPIPWKNLTVGGRFKLLFGGAHQQVHFDDTSIEITEEYARAEGRGTAQSSFFGRGRLDGDENGRIDMREMMGVEGFSMSNGFKSMGAAIDLGAELKLLDDRLKVSLGINDLGFIRWGATNSAQGALDDMLFEYRGYNTGQDAWDYTKPEDFVVTKTSNKAYNKRLATTMNIGAEWNFFDNLLGVGILSHTRFGVLSTRSDLTVTGTVRPAKWFTAALSHTLTHNRFGVFGLALNFHPRGFNFFFGMDYIPMRWAKFEDVSLPFFDRPVDIPVSQSSRSLNIYTGISFGLGGRSKPW